MLPLQSYSPSSAAEEGHACLEAAAAAAAATAAAAGENISCLVPWAGGPPKEVRGLSLLQFVSAAHGGCIPPSPPPLPQQIAIDFVNFCTDLQTTEIYHVRLYDPFEVSRRRHCLLSLSSSTNRSAVSFLLLMHRDNVSFLYLLSTHILIVSLRLCLEAERLSTFFIFCLETDKLSPFFFVLMQRDCLLSLGFCVMGGLLSLLSPD